MLSLPNPVCIFCKLPLIAIEEGLHLVDFYRCDNFGIPIFYFFINNKFSHYELHSPLNGDYYNVDNNNIIMHHMRKDQQYISSTEVIDVDMFEIYNNIKLLLLFN